MTEAFSPGHWSGDSGWRKCFSQTVRTTISGSTVAIDDLRPMSLWESPDDFTFVFNSVNGRGDSVRPLPSRCEMERAFLNSDETYDGVFYTAVKTTGIFCRPSCHAKKPLPQNVEFFCTVKASLFAGYRPCLRCRPLEAGRSHPEWVPQLFAVVEKSPTKRLSDADLRCMGIVPSRARQYFVKELGLTFQAYCRGRRLSNALKSIRGGHIVDDAVSKGGHSSQRGFADSFLKTFGRACERSRSLDCIRFAWIDTPLGPMIAGATADGICLLEFTDRRMLEREMERLHRRLAKPLVAGENSHHLQLRAELKEYFGGQRKQFCVPLVHVGSEFEKRVWDELACIPHGEVRSYEAIARSIGYPWAVRAVGRANGMNCLAILIPCHRVVKKNGDMGGYGGGTWRKNFLLNMERTGDSLSQSRL